MKFKCPSCGDVLSEVEPADYNRQYFTDEELSNDERILSSECIECRRRKASRNIRPQLS